MKGYRERIKYAPTKEEAMKIFASAIGVVSQKAQRRCKKALAERIDRKEGEQN